MANFNKVLLLGRLTTEPELRHTQTDTAVCEVSLAVNREFTISDGSRRKEACFVDIVFWARQAEVVAERLHTGSPLFVEGRLELDKWEGPDGQKRSRLRVVSEHFQILNRPQKRETPGNAGDAGDSDDELSWDDAASTVEVPDKPEVSD